ncbi:hypothetical protein LJY25_18285 [Hymenobacter sp. BT175]|uniref:hypothetical protein n=1 Tax=Hymenobacter translucens TaxID=2886507 RepID=UPI001D0E9F8A|nr:hypothetical protein [Hymenobacter translucens]MCC2548401.1 hypothetical protein [Hymenobacter translucens]
MKRLYPVLFLFTLFLAVGPRASAQLYDVRAGSYNYERQEREVLKVQVEGTADWTRNFWADWLKDNYNIKLKGGGVMGVGKKDVQVAKQTPANAISGRLLDLYSTVSSPSDSVSELSVFGSYGPDSFFSEDKTPKEYAALRSMVQSFAAAARLKAYREQIEAADKLVADTQKERERLEKETGALKASTASNLARIEALKKQNVDNMLKVREDSVKLINNARLMELHKLRLQQRRDRLTALDRK